jgi:PhnB protein
MKLPEKHQTVMPYLILSGAEKFSDFVKNVFDAELGSRNLRENSDSIMHAELTVGGSTIMFADASDAFNPQTANLFIYVADADESYQKALAYGATSVREPSDQDYGRTCGVKDPTGNTWWITSI